MCVCVCERERESVCVCARECVRISTMRMSVRVVGEQGRGSCGRGTQTVISPWQSKEKRLERDVFFFLRQTKAQAR